MLPDDFKWPFYQKSKQKCYLRLNHMTGPKYGFFKLSNDSDGLICVLCALFANEGAENNRGKLTSLGQLVQQPLRKYRCLTRSDSSLDKHLDNNYHKAAQIFADNFLITMKTGNDVLSQIDAEKKLQTEDNRRCLVPIVKTVICAAAEGIAMAENFIQRSKSLLQTIIFALTCISHRCRRHNFEETSFDCSKECNIYIYFFNQN